MHGLYRHDIRNARCGMLVLRTRGAIAVELHEADAARQILADLRAFYSFLDTGIIPGEGYGVLKERVGRSILYQQELVAAAELMEPPAQDQARSSWNRPYVSARDHAVAGKGVDLAMLDPEVA